VTDVLEVRFIRHVASGRPPDLDSKHLSVATQAARTQPVHAFVVGPDAKLVVEGPASPKVHFAAMFAIQTKAVAELGEQIARHMQEQGFAKLPSEGLIRVHVPDDEPEWLAPLTGVILNKPRIELWWKKKRLPLGLSEEERSRGRVRLDAADSRIHGRSHAITAFHRQIEAAGPHLHPVLLLAEPGLDTREVVRWLAKSGGRTGRRISQRLAGLPDEQATSLMFGQQFDDGRLRKGRIREAEHGVIHIPDMFDLSSSMQARFLRALRHAEEGRLHVESVGTFDEGEQVHVRFVAEAVLDPRGHHSQSLPAATHELYLHVAHTVLRWPPLRERTEDIHVVAEDYLRRVRWDGGITSDAVARLGRHPWWGNERELRLVLSRCVTDTPKGEAVSGPTVVRVLQTLDGSLASTGLPVPCDLELELDRIALTTMRAALRAAGDNRSEAGRLIGMKAEKNFGRDLDRLAAKLKDDNHVR
jgi:DNA-binding NtrC family response regulator